MPKTSKTSASETVEVEGYEGHLENLEGATRSPSRNTPPTPTSHHAGTEVIEFSPTEQLQQTLDVVKKNMEAAS